jgi:hypothetical protein
LKRTFLSIILIFCCGVSWGSEYGDELLRLADLTGKKDYDAAIEGYSMLAKGASTPKWLKAGAYYEIASATLQKGSTTEALAALDKAIEFGFDDCIAVQQDTFAGLRNSKDLQLRVAAMQISETDYHELLWLKSEMNNLEHDIKMMITENINRLDSDFTETPQSQIPTRQTESSAVLYARENVRLMQEVQKTFVKQSDLERIEHNAKMGAISGTADSQAVMLSKQQAAQRSEARKKDVAQRAFQLPANNSAELKSCSSYNTH